MREELEFTINLIAIIPENSTCYIQAPSLENLDFLGLTNESKYEWARQLILTSENKQIFKKLLLESEIEDQFQYLTIENQSEKLFEGFDGMEIGEISRSLDIPNWFYDKYIATEYCVLSQNW